MKRITTTLDARTIRRARAKAAECKLSLSRYIGEVLRKELRHDDAYEAAYRAWREDSKPFALEGPPQPYPKRDEIYDRRSVRRLTQPAKQRRT